MGNSEPGGQALRRGHAREDLSMWERLACNTVGPARSLYRNLPMDQIAADHDAELSWPRVTTPHLPRVSAVRLLHGVPRWVINASMQPFKQQTREGVSHRNHWNNLFEARVVIGRPTSRCQPATSSRNITTDIAIRPWATGCRPSTLRRAGVPAPARVRHPLNPDSIARL
jgi:hypothetical protein